MTTDPSWLYSTIAQSSAAIVAIIGGFITASVLTLMAEKRSLKHQMADKETQLNARRGEENKLIDEYELMRVENFFNEIADDLKKEDKLPGLDELLKRHPGRNLAYEVLNKEYEKLSKQRLKARDFIEQHSDKIDLAKISMFNEWVNENKLDISSYDYEILEEEYHRFRKRAKERREEEQRLSAEEYRKTLPAYMQRLSALISRSELPSAIDLPSTLLDFRPHQFRWEYRRLEGIQSRLDFLRYEIQLLKSEIASLDARINGFSYPPNLGWGIIVLGFLATFGILIPSLIIASESFFPWAKQITWITFWLGIIGVFAYVVFQIRTLKR